MKDTSITKYDRILLSAQLLLGFGTIGIGVWFLLHDQVLRAFGYYAVFAMTLGFFVMFTYRYFVRKNPFDLLIGLGALVFTIVITLNQGIFFEIVAFAFGFWSLFNAGVSCFELYLMYLDSVSGKILRFLYIVFELSMGFLLMFNPYFSYKVVNLQVSLYIIASGFIQIISAINVLYRKKQRVRLMAPVALAALLPSYEVYRADKMARQGKLSLKSEVGRTFGNTVSIYIYAKSKGHSRIGHIDIGLEGTIYSYGAHDPYHRAKSMAYGDGILIVGDESSFVEEAIKAGSTVFRFRAHITDLQKTMIERRIQELMNKTVLYDYPSDLDPGGINYLTRLDQLNVGLKFYKFREGKLRRYNVFKTNCVLVADILLESTGLKLYQMSGIVTPGAYYDFLINLLNKPGSMIQEYQVFRKEAPPEK